MITTRALAWVLLAVGLLAGLQTCRLSEEKREHAETVAAWATDRADRERETRKAVQAARDEEKRRAAEVQKAADDVAQQNLAQARADADAAADAGERLRAQLAKLTSSCGRPAGNPAAAGVGAPAQSSADLLADVQRRLDQAADGIARFADEAHTAGRACDAGWDALTPGGLSR